MLKHMIAMSVIALGCAVVSSATDSPQAAPVLFEGVMMFYIIMTFG